MFGFRKPMALHIEIQRADGSTLQIEPAAFDDFAFRDGDRLRVLQPNDPEVAKVLDLAAESFARHERAKRSGGGR